MAGFELNSLLLHVLEKKIKRRKNTEQEIEINVTASALDFMNSVHTYIRVTVSYDSVNMTMMFFSIFFIT